MNKKSKSTVTRTEDALEVGLARYNKPKSAVPEWAVQYGVWIVIAVVFLFVVVPFGIFGGKLATPSNPQGAAKLVALSAPTRIWAEGSATQVKSVQIKVTNQGVAKATAIDVRAVVRDQVFQLQGAAELESGKMASYTGDINLHLKNDDPIQIVMNCATCQ